VLSGEERFALGLDLGCGTGHSAVALAGYCDLVLGLDRSWSMLSRATAHARVHYVLGTSEQIPVAAASIGVVTFAGSLFYAERRVAAAEVRRVCPRGPVVVYDFEVLLNEVLRGLGMETDEPASDYDHGASFEDAPGFHEVARGGERVTLPVAAGQLAHIVLSDSSRLDRFTAKHGSYDPFPMLVAALQAAGRASIEAEIYYRRYETTR
jgi:SAM-dependent methyltransferase